MAMIATPTAATPADAKAQLRARVDGEYVTHLEEIARVFNDHAARLGLGILLDPTKAIAGARNFQSIARVYSFLERTDDSGVLHDAQLMTALDCVANLLREPRRNGLVLGAMQSGKTTTSLALQFSGPMIYLLTGRRIYPIYLVTSQTSQEDQTQIELKKFLDFYGELEVVIDEDRRCSLIEYAENLGLDIPFVVSPTVQTYREHVLRNAFEDVLLGPSIEDFVQRRVHGQGVRRVADLCRRANQCGFSPLLIIDEPQYGASDRMVKNEDGELTRRPCVLLQIFNAIEEDMGADVVDHAFIGLSATPYELNDLEAVWRVKQYLTPAYTGFNYFGGEVISDGVEVTPPQVQGFTEFGRVSGLKFFGRIDLGAYKSPPLTFKRVAKRIGFDGTQDAYRARVEDAVRAAIYQLAASRTAPIGICMRLFNDNGRAQAFLRRLGLDPTRIEVIEWFGSDFKGQSVKRAIESRTRKDLPFLIVVTNRARMGDAFPSSVEWFLDFSKKASDLNALLQGLLGRACGYGKRSNVVLSDENAQLVEDYKRTRGGLIYKPSRHSVVVGDFRRGAPTSLIRVRADCGDSLVEQFFERIADEVVAPQVLQDKASLSARRMIPYRTGPILKIAAELGLFEHLENPEVRARLLPTMPDGFRIARAGDQVRRPRGSGDPLGYTIEQDGNVRFTFRWTAEEGAHAGIQSRGLGERDATDRARAGNSLEPQIQMKKYDPATGEEINDKDLPAAERAPGRWAASMIVLPLVEPVRELKAGDSTFPVPLSPYSRHMTEGERRAAGYT